MLRSGFEIRAELLDAEVKRVADVRCLWLIDRDVGGDS